MGPISLEIDMKELTEMTATTSSAISSDSSTNRNSSSFRQQPSSSSHSNNMSQQHPHSLATNCLVGRQSHQISIYLNSTYLLCSGTSLTWPTLSGIVIMSNEILDSSTIVAVKLHCFMQYRSIARSVVSKLLFTQIQRLTPTQHLGPKTKYPFTFDFGSQALPPSTIFDQNDIYEGHCMGIHWQITGFLAKEVPLDTVTPIPSSNPDALTFQPIPCSPSISLEFQVAYDLDYSDQLESPSHASSKFSLFRGNLLQLHNKAKCFATLDRQVYRTEDKVKIDLHIENLHPSHVVSLIKLSGKQTFYIRFPDMNEWSTKITFSESQEQPIIRPTFSTDHRQTVLFNLSKFSKSSIISLQKTIYSLSPTTPSFKSVVGVWGAQISYHLKLEIHLSGGFVSFPINFKSSIKLPFILKSLPEHSHEVTFTPWSQVSPIPSWTQQSEEEVAHVISQIINDIQGTFTMLELLDVALSEPTHYLRQTMCTTYVDHAENLKNMMFQIHAQFRMFNRSTQTRRVQFIWPQTAVPVNTIALELEMMSKCISQLFFNHPSPPQTPSPVPDNLDIHQIEETEEEFHALDCAPLNSLVRSISLKNSSNRLRLDQLQIHDNMRPEEEDDDDDDNQNELYSSISPQQLYQRPPDYLDLIKDFDMKSFVKLFSTYLKNAHSLLIQFTLRGENQGQNPFARLPHVSLNTVHGELFIPSTESISSSASYLVNDETGENEYPQESAVQNREEEPYQNQPAVEPHLESHPLTPNSSNARNESIQLEDFIQSLDDVFEKIIQELERLI